MPRDSNATAKTRSCSWPAPEHPATPSLPPPHTCPTPCPPPQTSTPASPHLRPRARRVHLCDEAVKHRAVGRRQRRHIELAHVGETPRNGGRRCHCGGHEVRAATGALAALEVAVGRGRAALARLQLVGVHGQAHGAAGLAPVKARLSAVVEGGVGCGTFVGVDAQRSPGASLLGLTARHVQQPGSRQPARCDFWGSSGGDRPLPLPISSPTSVRILDESGDAGRRASQDVLPSMKTHQDLVKALHLCLRLSKLPNKGNVETGQGRADRQGIHLGHPSRMSAHLDEDLVKALSLCLSLDQSRARHYHCVCVGRDLAALGDRRGGTNVLDARVGARTDEDLVDLKRCGRCGSWHVV
eukprot:364050-Chlamydomonas_euryale.AAC.16